MGNLARSGARALRKSQMARIAGVLTDVELATAEWVDWYNAKRLHSATDYVPPAEYEQTYYAQHQPHKAAGASN